MGDKVAIRFQPQRAEIAVERGQTVLEAARIGKVGLTHKCGGHGTCGTCKIQIESKTPLESPTKVELRHLSDSRLEIGFRLACQCKLTGPATVMIPEDPLRRVVRELLDAQRQERQLSVLEFEGQPFEAADTRD
ncbi:MAG: 2Fe-2S iron-sulfur cluster binding domain-containing protein [Acidibacillus sp.]|uniref:Na(+)-translocating NADH-quinone reductase subunit F n=1 Tax=Sulfoacidibacillus ferrooxidans TaxID=2005001 RepID=A0A9X1V7T2_9BACL|nr:2Fe-2S iron-sulfur cluster binding domain-containing protein [Sulfoacidibacillus ferrooxidans]MCI0183256.1 Na(+)-translocating NADH-quinone reductase subunit F [Sulfoacidibacillus ferrooxidans]MCY0893788.1 2Fe-2S iron-sulfur cluster binding domain-containing protein [Acidibacillus sp.]